MKKAQLALILTLPLALALASCGPKAVAATPEPSMPAPAAFGTKTVSFSIPGMHCEPCSQAITKGVTEIKGVLSCKVDLAAKKAEIAFDPSQTSSEAIAKTIQEAGFKAQPLP